jgi:hypothetical protein
MQMDSPITRCRRGLWQKMREKRKQEEEEENEQGY